MSSKYDVTFHEVSPDVFARIKERVLGPHSGSAIDDNNVEISGVRSSYKYDAENQTLSLSILTTPAIVSQGYVIGWIHDAIRRLAVKA